MAFSFTKFLYAKGNIVIVAIDHLKKAKLIGPAKCIAYLDITKFPDQIMQAMIASTAPI